MHVKMAAVAGSFYPADSNELAGLVDRFLAQAPKNDLHPKAIIAPHAGLVYSGAIAGTAYRTVAANCQGLRRVVVMGPAHRLPVRGLAVSGADAWETPLGQVPLDGVARDTLLALPGGAVQVNDAAFAEEHCLEVQLPFLQRFLDDFTLVPVLVGQATAEVVAQALQAVWGGPETLIVISSDLSHFLAYDAACTTDGAAVEAIETLQPNKIQDHQACGRQPIKGLLHQAMRLDLRPTTLDVRNSGDTAGDKSRVVGYGAFAFEYPGTARLPQSMRNSLFDVAKKTIRLGVEKGAEPKVQYSSDLAAPLRTRRACFVTITLNGRLRGCIGSVAAHQPLVVDVAANAYRAAFGDPRFPALTADELNGIGVDVSILSTPRLMRVPNEAALLAELRPDTDGLIIKDGGRQALFLPSVWSSLPEPRDFLNQLRRKAGMREGHWSPSFQAYRFTTESFGDTK